LAQVRVGLLCGVVIIAAGLLMDMRERSLDEAQQQRIRHQNGIRATHCPFSLCGGPRIRQTQPASEDQRDIER
jgi:hypothetical protein